MANLTQTELSNHIPVITLESAQDGLNYLGKYLNLGRTVRRDFDAGDFAVKGKTLNVTKFGDLSVNDKSTNTSVTKQTPSDSKVQVTLNKHKEITLVIEDVAEAVTIPGVMQGYAEQAAIRIAEKIEQDLADLYSSAGNSISYATDWPTTLRKARRILVSNRVPKTSPMYAQIDQYAWETLLNTNVIEDSSQYGGDEALKEAKVQRLSGISLFESQVVGIDTSTSPDTYYPVVYGPDAMVLATRPLPTWGNQNGASQVSVTNEDVGVSLRSTMSYDADNLALQMTMDVLYGVKVLRSEHLVSVSHQPSVDT